MNRKLALFILLTIFLIAIVQAQEPRYTFKKSTLFDIKDACYNNGTYCGAGTNCYISILYPNSTDFILNKTMTNTSYPYWNYTLIDTQTGNTGIYQTDVFCSDAGKTGSDTFYFEITTTGTTPTITQGILYFIVLAISVLVLLLSLYGAYTLPSGNVKTDDGLFVGLDYRKYLKMFLWFASYLLLMWIAWLGWNITDAFFTVDIGTKLFRSIFYGMVTALFPIFTLFIVMLIINGINDKKLDKLISRGLQPR